MTRASAWNLAPGAHKPHALHAEARAWVEKNCYVDVWIEALHARGLEPLAMLAFTVRLDFLGDQWAFFKPPHADLFELYGIDVQELNLWRPLVRHAVEHLGRGDLVLSEADAFFLPDAQGTDYRRQHVKTTIVLETIDTDTRTLGYFHNGTYAALEGDDFDGALGIAAAAANPAFLPLFAEVARVGRVRMLPRYELLDRSFDLLRHHLARRPTDNPFARFKVRFVEDVAALASEGLAAYHAYAFATLRQCGANFELASFYLKWLDELISERDPSSSDDRLARASVHFDEISSNAKALVLKGARAVTTKKPSDFSSMLDGMETSWGAAMNLLDAR
jgi:Domain of unknown function (DUF1839)